MSKQSDEAASVQARIPGGSDLIEWFKHVPDFHDAEILVISLHRRAPSILRVHTWTMRDEVDEKGHYILNKHVVVTFTLEGVIDLQLDGFSHQNVIHSLVLRRAPDRSDRRTYYSRNTSLEDLEIESEPCFGMSGRIRCQKVRIDLAPGQPKDVSGRNHTSLPI